MCLHVARYVLLFWFGISFFVLVLKLDIPALYPACLELRSDSVSEEKKRKKVKKLKNQKTRRRISTGKGALLSCSPRWALSWVYVYLL